MLELYVETKRSYTGKYCYRMYGQNTSGEKLKFLSTIVVKELTQEEEKIF